MLHAILQFKLFQTAVGFQPPSALPTIIMIMAQRLNKSKSFPVEQEQQPQKQLVSMSESCSRKLAIADPPTWKQTKWNENRKKTPEKTKRERNKNPNNFTI